MIPVKSNLPEYAASQQHSDGWGVATDAVEFSDVGKDER